MPTTRPGVVSVVLVNFRGTDDTLTAIDHLGRLDWPADRLEIVVVENASGDDSAERLRREAPHVVLVESKENLGFAGGCNLGVRNASGEYIAFLNNDAKPDAAWVSAAVARFESSDRVGAVASRVLDWDGEKVDYIGSAMTWFGQGYKPLTAQPVPTTPDVPKDVLFGTGSAMFVRRSVYEQLGGFDERYFMFFEDVDLGWRLNLLGHRYVYEPASLAYHKHHASMSSFGSFKESYLLERNALFTQYKNLGDEALAVALPATLALTVRRGVAKGGLDSTEYDLRKGASNDPTAEISKETVAAVYAIDQFVENLPGLVEERERIQSTRVVTDARIWSLFGETDAPSYTDEHYLEGYDKLATAFPVTESPAVTRVLIVTGDPIGAKMAGPAIRAWSMAEALAEHNLVTLVSLAGVEPVSAPFDVVHVRPGDDRAMRPYEREADVIVFQGLAMALFDSLRKTDKIIVADVYDPMHLEQLEQGRELGRQQWDKQVGDATDVLNEQLERGDFFLCASERQRHFYLGQLAGLGRINPANYADDPDLEGLIDVVPFGLSETPPAHERAVLKGVLPGISETDKLLLWSGGLYNWFDPKSLIEAVARLSETHDDVRLFFQGTKHPHPGVPEMGIVAESRQLASDLGVLDRSVFFNSSWVDYADRQNYLTEADAGVSTHFSHVETTFSFRTRILDYLWAGLPMVVTEGDHFAQLVEEEKLGVVVPSGDVAALAAALEKVLYDEKFIAAAKRNVARVRQRYFWSVVLRPLVDFVADPRHAADLVARGVVGTGQPVKRASTRRKKHGLRHDVGLFFHYMRNGGPAVVVKKVRSRLGRR
ncbi:glycosyltransferase [Leifsonia sp. F6_8S_P_1B]|uniref:Glycosyltransferase n=1 Tax=Leifsonia williamsii TaxID=3035919 RepID=A0ABT8KAG6_9MICO|nr:glycosyltransferase [Leifsonia williamsii]MDN4614426.1 glycosyltransferase [Leifsonia williamsii]